MSYDRRCARFCGPALRSGKGNHALGVFLLGCGERWPHLAYEHRCTTEEAKTALAAWVAACIKDANPMSDEEPEDWIYQCENTGKRILCEEVPVVVYIPSGSSNWKKVSCAKAHESIRDVCPR